jgi:dipeptidyl aminopeptidase/acylaminoacyl peptidase
MHPVSRVPAALLVAAFPVFGGPAALGAQGALTLEQAAGMRQLGAVQLSPDGKWVAYTLTASNLTESSTNPDLWMVSAAGGAPVRLTNHQGVDDQPRWSPDGRFIAFLSSRSGKPQVHRLAVAGGEPEQLTESKTGVQAFAWAPDGGRIAFVAPRDPTPAEEQKVKAKDDAIEVDRNVVPARLQLVDVATRAVTALSAGDYQVLDPRWSPDGRQIAFTTVPTPKPDDMRYSDIRVIDVASRAERLLVAGPGPEGSPAWSPDGQAIAYLVTATAASTTTQPRLAVIPAAGGTPRVLGADFLYQPGAPAWSADGQQLWFWATTRTRTELYRVPAAGGAVTRVSDLKGATGTSGYAPPSLSRDGTIIAFGRSAMDTPEEVYVARLDAPWTQVARTTNHPELAGVTLARGEVIRWKGKDGMEIEGVLTYPVGYQPGRRYPTLAVIHGGPSGVWTEAFGANWYHPAQVFAAQGWLVFQPNIRGSGGYGEKFLRANYRDWGGGDYQDIQAGLDDLVRRGLADSTRLAQTGWSYGGYMTAWTLTQTNRFKAVSVGAGLTNMYSMYSTNDLQLVLEEYFGGEPWDDEAAYRRASAMVHIKKARTPTLILHGQVDTRVPIGQAQELYMGLKKNDVPVELVFFPREPHGLLEPRHQLDKLKRELAFFATHVLGTKVLQ